MSSQPGAHHEKAPSTHGIVFMLEDQSCSSLSVRRRQQAPSPCDLMPRPTSLNRSQPEGKTGNHLETHCPRCPVSSRPDVVAVVPTVANCHLPWTF
jgi:hypothetical protein